MSINALYRIFGPDDELFYIGITRDPISRIGDHRRTKSWAGRIAYITFEYFDSREELVRAERNAILNEGPLYNGSWNRPGTAIPDDFDEDEGWVIEEYDGPEPERSEAEIAEGRAAAEVMGRFLRESGDA